MRASSYAKALHGLLRDHPTSDEVSLLARFTQTVIANGHSHLLPKILKSFARITEKEEGKETIVVQSATPLSEGEVVSLLKKEPFKNLLSAHHKRVVRKTDPTLIGGTIIRAGATRLDSSYKRALLDIYQNFTNSL